MKKIFVVLFGILVFCLAITYTDFPAQAGTLDGQSITFEWTHFTNYAPPAPPSGTKTVFRSGSGYWGGPSISWGPWNTLSASDNNISVTINSGATNGGYDVIVLPGITLTGVTVTQEGVDRYGSKFGASRVSFDDHDIYLDINGSWNLYDAFSNPMPLVMSITTTGGVPEPATMLLLGCGLLGIMGIRRKRN